MIVPSRSTALLVTLRVCERSRALLVTLRVPD